MSEFVELLVGTFANKRQAQSHPTRYAHIRVSHRLLGENRIYGEQAYNYLLNRPYRQFVIDVVEDGDCLLYTSPSPRDSCASRMPSSA